MIKCKLIGPRIILGDNYKLRDYANYDRDTIYKAEYNVGDSTAYIEFKLLPMQNSEVGLVPSLAIIKAEGQHEYTKQLMKEVGKVLKHVLVSVFEDIHYGVNHLGLRCDNHNRIPTPRRIEIYKGMPKHFVDIREESFFKNADGTVFARKTYDKTKEMDNEFDFIISLLKRTYKVVGKETPDIYYIDGRDLYIPVGNCID